MNQRTIAKITILAALALLLTQISTITGFGIVNVNSDLNLTGSNQTQVNIENGTLKETDIVITNISENETSQSNETSLNITDIANETQADNFGNETDEINVTQIVVENATSNQTQSNVSDSAENETLTEEKKEEETQGAVLGVYLEYPNNITRGEPLTIRATVTNQGDADAEDVMLEWSVPEGFSVITEENECGTIAPNGYCARDLVLNTDAKTPTGASKIKVKVL